MDKITQYKKVVRKVVEYIASISPSDENVETQLIIDEERGHYLLYSVGWENEDYREYSAFVHIDVKPTGKVYVQHDGTDLKIAILLNEEGIPKSAIVLAFKAPYRREHLSEFAIA
jgi:XisI protein